MRKRRTRRTRLLRRKKGKLTNGKKRTRSTVLLSILLVLGLYSLGAHGIMVLNDFKAVEGDRATGLRSLPVTLGVERAALVACLTMAIPQLAVIAFLGWQGLTISALVVGLLTAAQLALMPRLMGDPARLAPWYNATGVMLYVLGMLAAALGLGGYI